MLFNTALFRLKFLRKQNRIAIFVEKNIKTDKIN